MQCKGSGALAFGYTVRYTGRGKNHYMIAEKVCEECGQTIKTYGSKDGSPRLLPHEVEP